MESPHLPNSNKNKSRLTVRQLTADFLRDFTDTDRGVLGTIVQLTLHPRRVVQAYLSGDRSRFIRPTRYLGFVLSISAAVFFIVQYWFSGAVAETILSGLETGFVEGLEEDLAARQARYSLSSEEVDKLRKSNARVAHFWRTGVRLSIKYYSAVFVASIPLAAFGHRWFYPRNTYNLPESIVASLYVYSHATILAIFLTPLWLILADSPIELVNLLWMGSAISFLYTLYAVQSTYGHRWWEFFVHLFFWMLLFVLIAVFAYSVGYVGSALRREDFFTFLQNHPLRFTVGLLLIIGSSLWFYLLYKFRRTPIRTTDRRIIALELATLPFVLLAIQAWATGGL